MATRPSTKSPLHAEIAALRLEVAELRATLLPLSVPALKELASLQQQLAKSARQALPSAHESEVMERLDELPKEVMETITARLLDFALPLLPVLVELHPMLGDALKGALADEGSST